jgi:glutathione synthase/RimK-type ligase-like ATP-grasp enzyme
MSRFPPGWLALATSRDYPDLPADERALIDALCSAGFAARAAVWDDPAVPWAQACGVVIRSCWDYHLAPERFLGWLEGVTAAGVPLINPLAVIRGNLDKRYLIDLAAAGCATVPTQVVAGEPADLAALLDRQGWDEAVIKPCVSGGAHRTWRLFRHEAVSYQERFAALVAETGAMVQVFLPEIVTDGEWSLVTFERRLSHVVRKRPKTGDFRVQDIHGGTLERQPLDRYWQTVADTVLARVPGDLAYARLDGVVRDGAFLIMEVELIEPNLYFAAVPEAVGAFVAAIRARLQT